MYTRIVENSLRALMTSPEILVLYGPRRVGKTTLLQLLYRQSQEKNEPTALYSLDDPTAQAVFGDPSTARLERIFAELGFTPSQHNTLFLDEVQGFPRIDLLLKLIYDHFPHIKVVATSSSSLLLLQGLTDSLAGRKIFIELLPLTLGEYTGIQVEDYFSFPEMITQAGHLSETLFSLAVYGMYPEVVGKTTPEEMQIKLRDILDSALYKDIFVLERLRGPHVLERLVALLAYQIGNLVNLNELATQLGISRNTVDQYIAILEKYFLIFRLPALSRNLRNELSSKFKVYFWDVGIRNAVINRFFPFESRDDKGAIFENMVVASILKRNLYAHRPFNAYFWRTYQGYEIDLVLESNQTQEFWAFQITSAGNDSFSKAFDAYQPTRTFVVTPNNAYRFCW
ncbi:MAG TPA: ATP-binding protein [Anaerolineales bacterium]|nr:ATP-binding protein [Anaerolineales bacterium]